MYKTITRIWRTFLELAEISEKWPTQEDKQEAPEDEDNKQMHSSGVIQPDPLLIERGQVDAIRLVRSTVNTAGTTTANELTEANATNVSGIPQMVFVDDEGLEEQFLTDGEDTANVLDTSANCVTTPVNTTLTNQSIQQTQHEELDLQPSRGPREESIVNTIDQFLDENYEDVLRTSNIQTNFSLSASDRNVTGCPVLPLGWIIPDGTNRTLEEIKDKKISNDHSPGGGQAGAVVMTLQQLEPYFGTQFFLVNLETGEMFAYIRQQWRRAGLYCSSKPFVINDLIPKVDGKDRLCGQNWKPKTKLRW